MTMKKVICVVEDEKAINDLVAQYLKKEGYEVRSYYTYEEAIAHVQDDDVHLWILDIMLDDKSGFDLIEEIRLQGKDIPVIFMSARDKEFDRIIGLEKGSDDYITKPFSPKELVLRVNNVIKRVYKNDSNRIMVDGYELDEEQRAADDAVAEQRVEVHAVRVRCLSSVILLVEDLIALRAAAKQQMIADRLQRRAPDPPAHDEGIQEAAAREQAGIQQDRAGAAADQRRAERK